MRILLAFGILLCSFVGSLVTVAVGGVHAVFIILTFLLLIGGFLSFRLTRTRSAPARPVRLTVSVTVVIAMLIMAGLQWSPERADFVTWCTLLGVVTAAIVGAIVSRTRPAVAVGLLVLPALNAGFGLYRTAVVFRHSGGPDMTGPSVTLAYLFAATLASGWLVAPWQAWLVWKDAQSNITERAF